MGRAGQGRPAKPTVLKVLHGDRQDRINTAEPVPSGVVAPPDGLSSAALLVWGRLAPDLERKGVLTAWDVDEFAVVCDAVARHRKAAGELDVEGETGGETGLNRFGERVVDPWFRVWVDSASVLAKFGGRFGLSPSDRQALVVADDSPTQGDDLLSG